MPDLGGEEGAIFFLFGEHEPHHLGVVVDDPRQVGGLEGGVADASGLDHGVLALGHHPRRRMIQSSPPRIGNAAAREGTGYPAFAGYDKQRLADLPMGAGRGLVATRKSE